MKKVITIVLTYLLASAMMWAGNGNGPTAISLKANGGAAQYHRISTDQWWDSYCHAISSRPELADLGNVTSLVLDGGVAGGWANGNDFYDTNTFRINYRVYADGAEAPAWQVLAIDVETYRNGNNSQFEVTEKNINLVPGGATAGSTYRLDAQILRNKHWDDGSGSGSWNDNGTVYSVTFTIAEPEYYVAGNGSDGNPWCGGKSWNAKGSKLTAGTITFSDVPAGTYECKVTDGNWGADHEFTTLSAASNQDVYINNTSGNICIKLAEQGDVTIAFDGSEVTVTTTAATDPHYYVAGNGVAENPWCDGKNWNATGSPMHGDEVTFSSVPAGYYQFKVTNGTWGYTLSYDNVDADCSVSGYYTEGDDKNIFLHLYRSGDVTIRVVNAKICITADLTPDLYYVTGNGTNDANGKWCDGKNWTVNGSLMTAGAITFSGVAPGRYGFKITDGQWGGGHEFTTIDTENSEKNVHLSSGGDISFTLDAEADVTITIDADKKIAVTSSLGRFVRTPYSIVGQEAVTGFDWNIETTATEMVRQSDGTYAFSIARVRLAEGNYQYKVVGGHSWDVFQYPAIGDNILSIASTGYYQLNYTFNPATDALACTATLLENKQQVTIGKYEYATLYAAETLWIPAGMHAYTVSSVSGDELVLEEISDYIIPANTGVIVEGSAATYDFYYAPTTTFEGTNLLKGSVDAQVVDNSLLHYVLGVNSADEVGLYWPNGTSEGRGSFTNGAGKAYLELPAGGSAPARFRIDGNRIVTKLENVMQPAPQKVLQNGQLRIVRGERIYDVTGKIVK